MVTGSRDALFGPSFLGAEPTLLDRQHRWLRSKRCLGGWALSRWLRSELCERLETPGPRYGPSRRHGHRDSWRVRHDTLASRTLDLTPTTPRVSFGDLNRDRIRSLRDPA
jgi:hypothetical protein